MTSKFYFVLFFCCNENKAKAENVANYEHGVADWGHHNRNTMKEKTKKYTLKCEIRSRFGRKWNGTVLSTGRFLSGADSSCLMFVAISYCIIWRKILDCFTQTSIAFRSLPLFRQSPSTLYSFIIACEQALRLTRKKETSLLTGYIKMDFFFARHRTENTTTWA